MSIQVKKSLDIGFHYVNRVLIFSKQELWKFLYVEYYRTFKSNIEIIEFLNFNSLLIAFLCVCNLHWQPFLYIKINFRFFFQALARTLNKGLGLKCQIFIVGSSVNGFGRHNSDCDLCLVVDKHTTTLAVSLHKLVLARIFPKKYFSARYFCEKILPM